VAEIFAAALIARIAWLIHVRAGVRAAFVYRAVNEVAASFAGSTPGHSNHALHPQLPPRFLR
jgi:cobalamin biosynthesis protein CobD/CbiB